MTLEQIATKADAPIKADALPREVEELLQRIGCSTSHYEALGIARAATNDQVRAGRETVGLISSEEDKPVATCNDEAPAVEISKSERSSRVASKNLKILVADDDHPLRKVLGKILTSAGYEVILVEDGQAAVEKAITERPDLVITDGLMPKMHGFLVCKAIKELQPPPKVILLTAVYTKMHYQWEAKKKYGADELMTKPFEVAELLSCIERHLAVSPSPEALLV